MVLGGQYVSRINLNLRADKGITYGARTAFDFRRGRDRLRCRSASTTRATALAIRESIGEIAAIRGDRPVSADELAVGVAALTRGYARNFETSDQIARAVAQLALYDLPDDYYSQFVPRDRSLTPDEVTQRGRPSSRSRPADHARRRRSWNTSARNLGRLDLGQPAVVSADSI